jgi:endonuclease G
MAEFEDIIGEVSSHITEGEVGVGLRMLLDLLTGLEGRIPADEVAVVRVQLGQLSRLQRETSLGTLPPDELERRWAGLSSRALGHIAFLKPRLERIGLPREIKAEPVKAAPATPQPDKAALEELVGGYLMSLSWMEQGLRFAKAICKVQGPANAGTGFVVGNSVLVTNNHVLPTVDAARRANAIFNFEEEVDGTIRATSSYQLDGDNYVTNSQLDCTMVKIKQDASQPPPSIWGALAVHADAALRQNDPVTIIQHPLGAPKKIGILGNLVMQVEAPYVYYTTDTMRGSSGSPVLDVRWNVVALHRAAGRWSKEQDRYLNNQGILISEIAKVDGFKPMLNDNQVAPRV